MTRIGKYLLFFLLCLVVMLVINLPVRQVLPRISLPSSVAIFGLGGTVVHGRALEISVNQFPIRDINYRFMPSCIATLKTCYEIDYEQGTIQVAYDLVNGDTEITRAKVEYPVSELAGQIPNLPLNPLGRLELFIDNMVLKEGRSVAAMGKLIWRDLGIEGGDANLNIGDYQIDFTGNQQKYDFRLSDLDASLKVDGKAEARSDGQYDVDIRIESESAIDPQVKSALDLFATNTSYNKYRIEQAGRLPNAIMLQLFR